MVGEYIFFICCCLNSPFDDIMGYLQIWFVLFLVDNLSLSFDKVSLPRQQRWLKYSPRITFMIYIYIYIIIYFFLNKIFENMIALKKTNTASLSVCHGSVVPFISTAEA